MLPTVLESDLVHRVRAEYLEMPGLSLTEGQACRMWSLDTCTCRHVLDELIEGRFLLRTRHGTYVLAEFEPRAGRPVLSH